MTDSDFYFLRALRYWDQLPSFLHPFITITIFGPIGLSPFLIYGFAFRKRRPEILRKALEGIVFCVFVPTFSLIFIPVLLLLFVAVFSVASVLLIPFLIIKGIKFIWHF